MSTVTLLLAGTCAAYKEALTLEGSVHVSTK